MPRGTKNSFCNVTHFAAPDPDFSQTRPPRQLQFNPDFSDLMASSSHPVSQFQAEVSALIAEIQACLRSTGGARGREWRLQRLVFHERCRQAEVLIEQLRMNPASWDCIDGDAERLCRSLRLSREFFLRSQAPQTHREGSPEPAHQPQPA